MQNPTHTHTHMCAQVEPEDVLAPYHALNECISKVNLMGNPLETFRDTFMKPWCTC